MKTNQNMRRFLEQLKTIVSYMAAKQLSDSIDFGQRWLSENLEGYLEEGIAVLDSN